MIVNCLFKIEISHKHKILTGLSRKFSRNECLIYGLSIYSILLYLTINWGISVCVCVCLSVRLYVSTVLNGSSPSLEENILLVMTRSVGYICCVCTQRARVRVQRAQLNRVRMLHEANYRQRFIYRHCVLNSHVYSKWSNGLSPNVLGTYYYSP
jgi:hypothetical protein